MPKPLVLDDGQVAELPDDQNLDASNIQLRGEALGYVITRDPTGSATAGLERYRTHSDGTIDFVRRDADGLVRDRFRGCERYSVARDADGLQTSETHQSNRFTQDIQVYSNNGTRAVPAFSNNDPEAEYIVAYLQAGFTETRQTDSTHSFTYRSRPFGSCVAIVLTTGLVALAG